jgi:acetyl esterase/lipase
VRIVAETAAPVPAEWTHPNEGRANGVLLYFHGGGFVSCSPRTHRSLVGQIVRKAGIRALSVDYRLAPQHPFPAALDDTTAMYRWLLDQGVSPGQIILGGDSAGGNLVLATLLKLRQEGYPMPAAAFCLSPVTDLTGSAPSRREVADRDPLLPPEASRWLDAYAAGAPFDQPLLSPLMADLQGLPPLLLQVGTLEILLDDSRLLAEKATRAGVETRLEIYPGLWHVFQMSGPFIPEAREAINSLADFIREKIEIYWKNQDD